MSSPTLAELARRADLYRSIYDPLATVSMHPRMLADLLDRVAVLEGALSGLYEATNHLPGDQYGAALVAARACLTSDQRAAGEQ